MARKKKADKTESGYRPGFIRKWRLRDYLLQLAVVMTGILVTFQGSALIQRHTQRRQAREILGMISDELRENLAQMTYCRKILSIELEGAEFYKRHILDIHAAPEDSVRRFLHVLDVGHQFDYSSNALEVLKASPESVNVTDKELLRDIFRCYDHTGTILTSINYYYTQKFDLFTEFYLNMDRRIIEMMNEGNCYPLVRAYLNNPPTRNFLLTASGNAGNRIATLNELIATVNTTLETIDGYVKRK